MRALHFALTCLLTALAILAVGVAGLAAAGVRPRLEASDSMRPLLAAGDVVWLDEIAARDARPGDVVAFRDPERPRVLLHRVRSVGPAPLGRLRFTTQGDATNTPERWHAPRDGTLGRYVGLRVPRAGRWLWSLPGPAAPALAGVSALLLAATALRRIWRRPFPTQP